MLPSSGFAVPGFGVWEGRSFLEFLVLECLGQVTTLPVDSLSYCRQLISKYISGTCCVQAQKGIGLHWEEEAARIMRSLCWLLLSRFSEGRELL